MAREQIGSMNGKWGWLFKIALATYPLVVTGIIAFCTWVVVTIHAHSVELASRPSRAEVQAMVNEGGPYALDRKYILESLTDIKAGMQRLENKINR